MLTTISKEELPQNNLENKTLNQNKSVSGFSLSSIALKKAANKKNSLRISKEKLPNDSFHQKDLELFWKKYTREQKNKGKNNIASILSLNDVVLEKSDVISFLVANEMNKVELHSEMETLLPYLRKKLNNFSLKVEIKITETIKKEMVFSPQEKYQHLLKVNNVLEDLRKTFDLDF